MKTMCLWLLLSATGPLWAGAPEGFRLPSFPLPTLAANGGEITEVTSVRLLRQLHQGGLSGFDGLETSDGDYALFRTDSITRMAGWLERMCVSVDFDLRNARARPYDGTVFSRLLVVGTSLAVQRGRHSALAMPIGVVLISPSAMAITAARSAGAATETRSRLKRAARPSASSVNASSLSVVSACNGVFERTRRVQVAFASGASKTINPGNPAERRKKV